MKILIRNARFLPDEARRPALIKAGCLAALGPGARRRGELNIVFLKRASMRQINRKYLGHDYDTDVIAFPYPAAPSRGDDLPFGDIFVSVDQARRQARELGHDLLTELLRLAVHGTLHLRGYRDDKPALKKRMFARQEALLKRLLPSPRG